jgi:hypothetical protein
VTSLAYGKQVTAEGFVSGDSTYITDLLYSLDLILPQSLASSNARAVFYKDAEPEPSSRYKKIDKRKVAMFHIIESIHLEDYFGTTSKGQDGKGAMAEKEFVCDLLGWRKAVDAVLCGKYGRGMLDLFDNEMKTEAKPRWTMPESKSQLPLGLAGLTLDDSSIAQSGRAYLKSQGLDVDKLATPDQKIRSDTSAVSPSSSEKGNVELDAKTGHPVFRVSKKQLKLSSRLLGDDSREDAGQVRWDDIVKVSR